MALLFFDGILSPPKLVDVFLLAHRARINTYHQKHCHQLPFASSSLVDKFGLREIRIFSPIRWRSNLQSAR